MNPCPLVFATIEEHEEEAGEMLYYLEIVIVVWFGIEFFVRKYLDWPSLRLRNSCKASLCTKLIASDLFVYLFIYLGGCKVGIMLISCAENIQESGDKNNKVNQWYFRQAVVCGLSVSVPGLAGETELYEKSFLSHWCYHR